MTSSTNNDEQEEQPVWKSSILRYYLPDGLILKLMSEVIIPLQSVASTSAPYSGIIEIENKANYLTVVKSTWDPSLEFVGDCVDSHDCRVCDTSDKFQGFMVQVALDKM